MVPLFVPVVTSHILAYTQMIAHLSNNLWPWFCRHFLAPDAKPQYKKSLLKARISRDSVLMPKPDYILTAVAVQVGVDSEASERLMSQYDAISHTTISG